jgi:hypothetical protein
VFPVSEPFLKACFVIVEDNRFAIRRFNRQRLLLGLLRDVDQRLAAEATVAGLNGGIEINSTRHLLSHGHQFGPKSV